MTSVVFHEYIDILPKDEGWGRGQTPVIKVSWDDAKACARWLSQQTDKHYRLPAEAEWEYAARSGGKNETWAGTSDEDQLKNYAVYGVGRTEPVGSKHPWARPLRHERECLGMDRRLLARDLYRGSDGRLRLARSGRWELRRARDPGRLLGRQTAAPTCFVPGLGLRRLPVQLHRVPPYPRPSLTLCSLSFYPFPLHVSYVFFARSPGLSRLRAS